jgi:hypothetical protein
VNSKIHEPAASGVIEKLVVVVLVTLTTVEQPVVAVNAPL